MVGNEGNQEMKDPVSNKAQLLRGAGNRKTIHIKGQRKRTVDYAGKPPDHGRRMTSRQILDTHGREVHARPKHHQPVPSQYRAW